MCAWSRGGDRLRDHAAWDQAMLARGRRCLAAWVIAVGLPGLVGCELAIEVGRSMQDGALGTEAQAGATDRRDGAAAADGDAPRVTDGAHRPTKTLDATPDDASPAAGDGARPVVCSGKPQESDCDWCYYQCAGREHCPEVCSSR